MPARSIPLDWTCPEVDDGVPCGRTDHKGYGLCTKHYMRAKLHGQLPSSTRCPVVEDGMPCGRAIYSKGVCNRHWQRMLPDGSIRPREKMGPRIRPPLERLLETVEIDETGCWHRPSTLPHHDGFSYFAWTDETGKKHTAKTVCALREFLGQPIKQTPRMVCGDRECVNPDHVEDLPWGEAYKRNVYATKTHCPQGHPYDDENTYINPSGWRACNACRLNTVHIRRTVYKAGDMDISEQGIRERYGNYCHICGMFVDFWLSFPDPWSFSIEHVIPVVAGGTHTWDNVQTSHLFCNLSKNDGEFVDWMAVA